MSNHFDPAIAAELDRRRSTLRHDAEQHQLARRAGRAARAAATRRIRLTRSSQGRTGRPLRGHAHA